jgi:hypothetical protein
MAEWEGFLRTTHANKGGKGDKWIMQLLKTLSKNVAENAAAKDCSLSRPGS